MKYHFNTVYPLHWRVLQKTSLLFLLLMCSCNCRNEREGKTYKDNLLTPTPTSIGMKVTPLKLIGDQKQVEVSFTIPNDNLLARFPDYKLKITFSPTIVSNLNNSIDYMDATRQKQTKTSIDEKLNHFINDIISESSRSYTLPFALVPDPGAVRLIVHFELFNDQDKRVQNGEVVWEDIVPDLKIESEGKTKLIGDNKDFRLKITNAGPKDTIASQVKLAITRVKGNKATVELEGQPDQLQELELEGLKNTHSTSKEFKINPNNDERAEFLFQLVYKGQELASSVTIIWQESWLEIVQLYYNRGANQVFYQVSNHGSLQKDAVELVYKNLSNNEVTLAGATEQSINLGTLDNLSHPYAGLQVNFNGEPTAEFEFKLTEKGKIIETKIVTLKNFNFSLKGIEDGQIFLGKSQLTFNVKNKSGARVNIEDIYIQGISTNGVDFEWQNTNDIRLPMSLAACINKKELEINEEFPLSLKLKDAHNATESNLTLEIQERIGNQVNKLTETTLNWEEG